MARGLLEQGAPGESGQGMEPGSGMAGRVAAPEPGTSDQKKQIDLFIKSGRNIIMSDQVKQQIASIKDNPIEQLGGTVLMVITRLEGIAQDAGEKLDPDAELVAANTLLADIFNIYEQSSGQTLTDDQKAQTFSYAVSTYIADAVQTGKISKDELQQLAQMAKQSENGKQIAAQVEQAVGQANNQAMAAAGGAGMQPGAQQGMGPGPGPGGQQPGARPQRAGLLA